MAHQSVLMACSGLEKREGTAREREGYHEGYGEGIAREARGGARGREGNARGREGNAREREGHEGVWTNTHVANFLLQRCWGAKNYLANRLFSNGAPKTTLQIAFSQHTARFGKHSTISEKQHT